MQQRQMLPELPRLRPVQAPMNVNCCGFRAALKASQHPSRTQIALLHHDKKYGVFMGKLRPTNFDTVLCIETSAHTPSNKLLGRATCQRHALRQQVPGVSITCCIIRKDDDEHWTLPAHIKYLFPSTLFCEVPDCINSSCL